METTRRQMKSNVELDRDDGTCLYVFMHYVYGPGMIYSTPCSSLYPLHLPFIFCVSEEGIFVRWRDGGRTCISGVSFRGFSGADF